MWWEDGLEKDSKIIAFKRLKVEPWYIDPTRGEFNKLKVTAAPNKYWAPFWLYYVPFLLSLLLPPCY